MPGVRTNYRKLVVALIALLATAILLHRQFPDVDLQAVPDSDRQMPVSNPPLDPNRPDLIGEPRIEERSE